MDLKLYSKEELEDLGFTIVPETASAYCISADNHFNCTEVYLSDSWQMWLKDGEYHRTGEPAHVYSDGSYVWYENGIRHKYDAPAAYYNDLSNQKDHWVIRGRRVVEHEYRSWLIESGMDISNLSDEDKILIDLKWGI